MEEAPSVRRAGKTGFQIQPKPLDMLYPMYVVRVKKFLDMKTAQPHQVLKEQGLVTIFLKSFDAVAAFISHQWCGRFHADPHFRQLGMLQKVFRNAMCNKLVVETDIVSRLYFGVKHTNFHTDLLRSSSQWFIWYDFFSVPQPFAPVAESTQHCDLQGALGKAVASLAAYVANCKIFIVLAPSIQHDERFIIDYHTWKSRGWCRLERLARVLSSRAELGMLLVDRGDTVFEIGAAEWLFDPVGQGCFTVESDKERVGETARRLLENRLHNYWAEDELVEFRRLMALRSQLLHGLPIDPEKVLPPSMASIATGSAGSFLKQYCFASPTERSGGTCPLLLAACAGNTSAITAFIQAKADIHSSEQRADPAHVISIGTQAVHHAAWNGHIGAMLTLLEHRARVDSPDSRGVCPLHCAAFRGDATMIRLLLEHRANINSRDSVGISPMLVAVLRHNADCLRYLLDQGASTSATSDGLTALHVGAVYGMTDEIIDLLCRAGTPLEGRLRPRRFSRLWMLFVASDLSYRLGGRSYISLVGHHCWGVTPLMAAVMADRDLTAAGLLERGSDPRARNDRGLSAARIAWVFNGGDTE